MYLIHPKIIYLFFTIIGAMLINALDCFYIDVGIYFIIIMKVLLIICKRKCYKNYELKFNKFITYNSIIVII